MREVKIYLKDELNDRFRRTAMEAFGYGRGSISKAAEEAILQWCERRAVLLQPANRAVLPATSEEKRLSASSNLAEDAHDQGSRQSLPTGS